MKQTNNAIKFLLAQYRAIFKHAYLKGLASAVVMTAGLAAGATANAEATNPLEVGDIDGLSGTITIQASNLGTDGSSPFDDIAITVAGDKSNSNIQAVNINGTAAEGASLSISGSGNLATANAAWKMAADGKTLTIGGTQDNILTFTALSFDVNSNGTGTATLAIKANKNTGSGETTVNLQSLNIGGTASGEVELSGSAADSGVATLNVKNEGNGTLTLGSGGTLTLQGFSSVNADKLVVNSGSIATETAASNTITVDSAEFSGGSLTVGKALTLAVTEKATPSANTPDSTPDVVFTDTTLSITDTLTLSGGSFDFKDAKALTAAAGTAKIVVSDSTEASFKADALTGFLNDTAGSNDGTLNVGSGSTLNVSGTLSVDDTNGIKLAGANSGTQTILLKKGSTLKVDTLELTKAAGEAVSGEITTKNLELAYDGGATTNLSNLTVTQALKNTHNAAFTLKDTITLVQDSGLTDPATISGSEIKIVDGSGNLAFNGDWSSTAKITVSGTGATLGLSGEGNSLTFKDEILELGKAAVVNVDSGAELAFEANTGLNINADTTSASFTVDGGNVTFANQSTLSIKSGNFTVKNTEINISTAIVSGGTGASIIADEQGTIIFNGVKDNIAYVANANGTLKTSTLNVTTDKFQNSVSNAGLYIAENGTLSVDSLTFTDQETKNLSNLSGSLLINKSLSGADNVTFTSGKLNFNAATGTTGTINSDLNIGGSTAQVLGTWTATNKTISVSNGSLDIGDGETAGSLTTTSIEDTSAAGAITVNQGSLLKVNGDTSEAATAAELAGENGYYGFSLKDKTVNVSGGTFEIGESAIAGLKNENWDASAGADETDKNYYVNKNFGQYNLTNSGVLKLDFADKTILTQEEFTQIKIDMLVGADPDTGVISTGSLDIGNTDIDGVTTGDSAIVKPSADGSGSELTYDSYLQYKDRLSGLQQDAIKAAQFTGVSGSIDSMHVGSVELAKDITKADFIGASSLNKADGDNLIVKSDGSTGGAALQEGASLSLNDDGKVAEVTLTAGSDKSNVTTLNANKTNTLASVVADNQGNIAANTAFVVGAESKTTVTGEVKVETLTNNNSLIVGGDVATTTFNNSGSFISDSGTVTTETFADVAGATTTAKSLTITDESTVAGKVIVTDTFKLTSSTQEADPNDGYKNSKVSGIVDASSGSAELSYVDINSGASVTAKTAVLDKDVDIAAGGQLISKETTIGVVEDGTYNVTADISIAGYANLGKVSFTSGNGTIKSFLNVLGGEVVAESITGTKGAIIAVGADATDGTSGSTGALEITKTLDLNGATLKVDPEYDQNTALVAVKYLTAGSSGQNKDDVGIFNGNVFVGQNSALGVGVNAATLQSIIAQYQQDGHFLDPNEDGNESAYGAMLYLEKPVSINQAYGITLTAGTAADLTTELGSVAIRNGGVMADVDGVDTITKANTIYFGANTALAVNTNNAKANSAYISFIDDDGNKAKNSTLVANGGEIVLYGDSYKKTYQLFDSDVLIKKLDNTTTGEIAVVSANGFLKGALDNSSSGSVSLKVNEENIDVMMAGTSTPVQQSIMAYVNGYNGDAKSFADSADDDKLFGYDKDGQKAWDAYNNYFLSQVVLGGNGSDVEKVARLGVYGGVAQAALTAGATTYEAVNSRMGVGAQNGSITFADNGQGAGLWVTPIYKNHDSDGFEAQGVSYGADLDLYGVALGADYTLANGLRLGAAFNVGSGDADGQGAGADVSNDFDYYGFTVYGGYTLDKLSVVADISYTAIDNDVEANTGVEKVTASMDSSNLSFGVTGQYAFDMNGVSVTPHAGLRYTYIDMDDYTVKGSEDIAKYAADSASIFSIPVGVTFAKEITTGAWTIKPALDLTLTANMGDDSVDGSVTWAGVENLKTNLESEVIDNFTYGATLGVSAKSGNMSFGLGINYTGASSADEYGVSANARFVF